MITIRPFAAADREAWLPLWHGYQSFYRVEIAETITALSWARMLDPAEPMFGALAWKGDHAVGMVHWIMHRSVWTPGDYCYLQDLFVSSDLRGEGIGRN